MKTYPLLQTQMGIFVECLKYPESTQYNLPGIAEIADGVDLARLEKALYIINEVREELRIRFLLDENGMPVQYAAEDGRFCVRRKIIGEAELFDYAEHEFIRPFDLLGDEPLFRAEIVQTEKKAYLLWDYHHILMDGISCFHFINRDLPEAYAKGTLAPYAYGMLAHAQTEVLSGKNYDRDRAYFLDKFKDCPMTTLSGGSGSPVGHLLKESSYVNIEQTDAWCAENKVPVDVLFQAAFSHALMVYARTDRVAYSMMSEARFDKKLRDSYGMYVSTIPVFAEETAQMTVREFISACASEKMTAMRHHFYPFTHFCQELHTVPGAGFNFVAFDKANEEIHFGDQVCPLRQPEPPSAFEDMTASIYRSGENYEIRVTSSDQMNDRVLLAAFSRAVRNTLLNMMRDPDTPIREISTLSEEEEREMLALSEGERIAYAQEGTWLDLFAKNVEQYPDHIAITDCKSSITYRELDRQSDAVASYLIEQGIRENDFVAIETGRVKEYAIALLGIQKAGAAYVPIDLEYPQERIRYMLEDSEAKVVLTEELVHAITAEKKDAGKINRARRNHYAYMIYTSGSTGRPKGVIQSHRSLCRFVSWRVEKLEIRHEKNYGHFSGFAFDASLDDLACPLAAGASVYILDEELRRNIAELDAFIEKNRISGLTTSTLFGMELIKYDPAVKLDYLMMGGEKLYPCGDTQVRLINGYGPTEFTVCSSYYVVQGSKREIPIGRPVPNTASYICDANGNLLAKGITGELLLAGEQMAEGYWKQPELTREKFTEITVQNKKIKVYKTGDLARYNADGQLEYMGRIDSQVKLRGYRVELGEIESQAVALPFVEQAAADVRNGQIVLYYTVNTEKQQSMEDELRRNLAEQLADYMLPGAYMRLDALPLTPNGKIDKKALPDPAVSAQEYVSPETPLEQAVAQCMQKVLGENCRIGALDSFFAFGGDSIKAIRLVSLLREQDVQIRVSDIMARKTVRAIAACAAKQPQTAAISQEPIEGAVSDSAIVRFYKDLRLPVPEYFNQAILLKINGKADKDALQEALNAVTAQHDMLRAVYKDETLYVRPADTMIEIREYHAASEEEVRSVCAGLMPLFHMEEGLFAVALIRTEGVDFLCAVAHHLIIDAVSLRIFASDLETAYAAARKGEAVRLSAKTSSYAAYVQALYQYRESYHLQEQIPYWNRVQRRLEKLPASALKDYGRSFGTISVSMDEASTAAFAGAEKEKLNLEANDILTAAVARAYCAVKGADAVSLQLEGHGRENLADGLITDRTIGWFTSVYPVVLEGISGADEEAQLLDDLIRVKEELHAIPDKGAGYNVLRYLEGPGAAEYAKDTGAQIGFNYLGEMDETQERESLFTVTDGIPVELLSAKENCFGPALSINCMVTGGCFRLFLQYNEAVCARDEAEKLAREILAQTERILAFLHAFEQTVVTATDLGETEWSQEEFQAVAAEFAARGEHISRIYPLLPMQEGILFKHVSEPEVPAYRLVNIFEMDALPTQEQLSRALDRLSRKYEVLRAAIVYENVTVPRQVITDRALPFNLIEADGGDPFERAKKIREELLCSAFDDLAAKPLFRLVCLEKDGGCYLITAVHHIIVDGWSLQNYMADLFAFLKEEIGGTTQSGRKEIHESFDGLHERYVRQILELDENKALRYWGELLSGYETRAEIPAYETPEDAAQAASGADMAAGAAQAVSDTEAISGAARLSSTDGEVIVTLGRELTGRIAGLCKEEKATISNGVELLWGLVLMTWSNTDDAVFAKVVSGRDKSDTDISRLTGLFINSVPVRVTVNETLTARQLLGQLQQQAARSNEYDYCGLSRIQQQTALGKRLLQTVLAFENYGSGAESETELEQEGQNIAVTPALIREENYGELNVAASVTEAGELCLHLSYDKKLYADAQIRQVGELFCVLAQGMADRPDEPLVRLPRISEDAKAKICALSAGDPLEVDTGATWLELFTASVEKYPDSVAVTDSEGSITYRELDEQSDALARYLVENGAKPDSFVALKMDRVKEFVIAVVGIHKAGAAYVPIDLAYPEERIHYMLENAQAKLVLTGEDVKAITAGSHAAEKFVSAARPESFAYMIYTSGSTGRPKGVVIHHAALMNYTVATTKYNRLTHEDRIGHHFSFSFDSHIEDVYPPLAAGAQIFLMPEQIRREPELICRFLNDNRITGGGFTTTIGKMIVTEFDLKLRYVALMGEALNDIVSTAPQILNKYGPTECTNISVRYEMEYGRKYKRIPIGRPMENGFVFILDRHGNLLPKGVAGELCYAGPQVGRGYWRDEERSKEAFSDCPFAEGLRMYHTGDLARYNSENQIEYLGRMDQQIKLRGYRVELGEIESRAQEFPGISLAAADVKDGRLCLYYTAGQTVDEEELNAFLAESLAEYMVPSFYMVVEQMPSTPSGKVDRRRLPAPNLADVRMTAPEGAMERVLLPLAAEILGTDRFGVTDNLISLGLSSLAMMKLAADIKRTLGGHVSVAEIMKAPTVREIAAVLRRAEDAADKGAILSAQEPREYYPLTENQKGVYLDWEMNRETTQYNVPSVYVLEHADADRLEEAVRRTVDAHPYLKTRLLYVGGELVQKPCAEETQILRSKHTEEPDAAYFQGKVRPFDLLKDRLYRIEIASCGDRAWLFIDAHHIIYDGLSNGLLINEILRVYRGGAPAKESVSAYDFALFEQSYRKSGEYQAAKEYFDRLVGGAEALDYPDSVHPDGVDYATMTVRIPGESIDRFCQKNEVTPGAFMQAAFSETLKRVTREENAVYATISSGRSADPQLLGCMGMFARTLPATLGDSENMDCQAAELVKSVYSQMQQTLEHELYPYTRIVEDHGIRAQIMFVFQGGVFESGDAEGAEQLPLQLNTVKFALSVTAYPDEGDYVISMEYDGRRYGRGDMHAFAKAMGNVALNLAKEKYLRDVKLLDESEEQSMLARSTGETLTYDRNRTWIDLFLEAAAKDPDHIAVQDEASSLTYRELDEQSDRVAAYLVENDVKPNTFVAVKMGRVKEFVTAVTGIHKAGAAYVPIDASYPEERIRYMLEDSKARVVLTEEVLEAVTKDIRGQQQGADRGLTEEALDTMIRDAGHRERVNLAAPGNLAYMIYTSGSTGKPKGAMVPHSALLNFVHFIIGRLNMRPESRIACHTSFSFDVTVENIFPVLSSGGCTIIVPESVRKDVDLLYDFFREYQVTGTHITTQMGQLLGSQYCLEMEYIRLSGEAMTSVPKCTGRVYNAYGPTECTVDVSDCEVDESLSGKIIPIGKPMAGSCVYVVDQYGQLLPQGMAGELYLGGEQVGAGYFNKPEMTAEKFIEITLSGARRRVYKSGDLGRYMADGQIEYLGRMDHQVKFRGFRIELGEIESRAMLCPGVEQAVAMVKNEQLVLYYTKRAGDTEDAGEAAIRHFLAEELTDYMLPTVYICMDAMPLTPNGKVNRKALPEPHLTSHESFVEPKDGYEATVAQCMQRILGRSERVGALDSFFALGGDSIKAIRLVSLLREKDMELRVADVMRQKTVRAIAECASDRKNAVSLSQEPIEGGLRDSAIVRYFKDLHLPVPSHFNQSVLLRFADRADLAKLQTALHAVTVQHDMLRAVVKDESLYIRSADTVISIEEYTAAQEPEVTALCERLQAGIDMGSGLFRAALIHTQEADLLFLLAHHLIIDGVSWRILVSDLEGAYAAASEGREPALPAKTSSYADYVGAIEAYRGSYSLEKEIPYWNGVQQQLEAMPCSRAKDYERSFSEVSVSMSQEETSSLLGAAKEGWRLEINDILLTAVARAFCAQTGRGELSVQMEGHGREALGDGLITDRTVGWFTSIYPVVFEKIRTEGADSIRDDLIRVKETLRRVPIKGVGYNLLRYLPGERAVLLGADRVAMMGFNYLGETDAEHSGEGMFAIDSSIDTGRWSAKENCCGPDLDLNCAVTGGCFRLSMSCNESLYDDAAAKKLADAVLQELKEITEFLNSSEEPARTASDLGETEWQEEQFEAVVQEFAAEGVKISRIYPLLPLQEGMLYKHITDPASWGYRLVQIYEMNALPNGEQLRRALDRLGKKYEVLRTAIVYENVPVARQVITDRALPFTLTDLSGEQDPFAAACRIREDILTNGFELTHRSLFRLVCAKKDANSCYIISAAHHMIVDGWSLQNYMTDLFRYIGEEIFDAAGGTDDTDSMDGMYEAYVRQLLELDKNEGLRYWSELLKGYDKKAQIPSFGVTEVEKQTSDDYLLTIDKETTDRLAALCMEEKATINSAVELAWGLVLQTYSHTDDAVFAKVVSGRDKTRMDLSRMAGLFINSVPVRVTTDADATARQMLDKLQRQAAQSNAWDFCPLPEIQRQSELGNQLLQTVLAFENYTSGAEAEQEELPGGLSVKPLVLKEETFDEMHVTAYVTDAGELCLHVAADHTLFTELQMNRVTELFRVLITGIAQQPDAPLRSLPRLSEADEKAVMELSWGGDLNYPADETWVDQFLASARKYPEHTAVVDAKSSMTYRELDEQSNAVAAYLLANGVKENSFVAIRMDRVKEYMVAILGVFKAGAAYLPIDSEYPESRVQFMLEDSGTRIVLTRELTQQAIADYKGAKSVNLAAPDHYAYMIYTSGSTGVPKGVLELHSCLYNFTNWTVPTFGYKHEGRYGILSSFAFDGSLIDYASGLAAGGTVHIFDEDLRRNLIEMEEYMTKHQISGLYMPTLFGAEMAKYNPALKVDFLLIGGIKFLPYGKTEFPVYHVYGPTEFTILSSYHPVEDGNNADTPIGRPAPGNYGIVCDNHGNPVPQGVIGELYLAGVQRADGYWKRPELTAEKFVDCEICGKKRKAYRTGDLVRYNEDGFLEYYDRIDSMVKFRGFRVELGEIEHRAMDHPAIEYAVVDIKRDQLVLYYIPYADTEEPEPTKEELSAYLAETLADYMVPTFYVKLDEMPKTQNGKVDKSALPEPVVTSSEEYVEPQTEGESAVAAAMQRILGLSEPVGALDSFFALGGDSIKAIRLVSLLRERDLPVRVSDVMSLKTVRAIAGCVSQSVEEAAASQEPVTGEVPDTAIICFYKDLALPEPDASHLVQSILLRMRERADLRVLQEALNALTEQHDMLRAVLREDKLYAREADAVITVEEYEAEEKDVRALCMEIQDHIDTKTAMLRAALIHTRNGDKLFFAAHHLIVDGVSWRILSADLETAYEGLLGTGAAQLPAKTASYVSYAQALQTYRDSYRLAQEIPYWNRVQERLLSMPVSHMKDFDRSFSAVSVSMDREATAKVIRADREKLGLSVNDVLLTAVARAYCKEKHCAALSVQMEGHGRENIAQGLALDRTIGWFTSIYPVVFEDITAGADPKRDLIRVKETLHRVPDKGVGYGVLRYMEGAQKTDYSREEIAQLGFNYLGEMDAEQAAEGLFAVENSIGLGTDEEHQKNRFCPDLDLNSMITDGSFTLTLSYNEALYTKEEAQKLAAAVFEELGKLADFINSCEEKIVTASDFGETQWSEEEFEAVMNEFKLHRENVSRIYPLLPMQEGMLYKHISEPDSRAYRLVSIYELGGIPTERQLRSTLDRLGEKYEVLRSAFVYENVPAARQLITDRLLPYRIVDLSGEADPFEAVCRLREEILTNEFDLARKPLFKLVCAKKDEKSCYLLVVTHHIIVDGWSQQNYLADLFTWLLQEMAGTEVPRQDRSLDGLYETYVRRVLALDKNEALAYWRELLEGYDTRTEIPSYGTVPEEKQSAQDELVLTVDRKTTDALAELCREEKATLSNVAELAWGLVLQTYNNTQDAVFAKVVSGRDKADMDVSALTGLFINSVPVRVTTDVDATARQMIGRLQQQATAGNAFDYCPLAEIQRQSVLGDQLLQTVFAFQNYNSGADVKGVKDAAGITVTPLVLREETFNGLSVDASVNAEGELCLHITFDRTRYTGLQIRQVMELFRLFAQQIAVSPDMPVSRFARVSEEERKEVCAVSVGERIAYPQDETWIDLFLRAAKQYPDQIAVVDRTGSMTYRELDQYSDLVAASLLSIGVKPNEFVAIKMKRGREFPVAVIGIQKAGAAYVPIDADYPEDRVNYMLEDSGAKAIVTEDIVQIMMTGKEEAQPVNLAKPEHYAYMIYTSGSTGRPKGVIQSHRSLHQFACWRTEKLGIQAGKQYGHFNSFSFDGSLDDLICPLSVGAAVHIFDEDLRRSLSDMDEYLSAHEISGMTASTQFGMELIRYNPKLKLDYLMMGGEKLLPCEHEGFDIINGYGPTEFTVCTSYYVVKGGEENIPIGRPVPNTASFICDRYGNLLPRGVAGEICLSGAQMAEGYWKLPDMTAEKFTEIMVGDTAVRVYKTGDLARYNEDGQLEYIGRTDSQVKLRGYRIEFGEIESHAILYPTLRKAVAAVKNEQLILYYVLKDEKPEAEELEKMEADLQAHLAERLSDYMVPTHFMCIDEIPLTPGGKVDHNALPEPVVAGRHYVAPETLYETAIAQCVQDVLGISYQVGALDNFYQLGGDSIKAMRMVSILRKKNIRLQISDITKQNNVRQIAALAQEREETSAVSQEAISGSIPDSAIVSFFKYLKLPQPSFFTQSMLLRVSGRVDAEKLQRALRELTRQHDMLRAVVKDGGLYIRDKEAVIALEEYELTDSRAEALTQLCTGIKKGIDMESALLRAALIHRADEELLFLVAHHLIIDGVSWRVLLPDLETACLQLLDRRTPVLEEKTSNYRDYAEALQAYRDSEALKAQIPYWEKVQEELVQTETSDLKDYTRSFAMLEAALGREETALLLSAKKENMNLDMNDVLLAAVARAYCREMQTGGVSVQLEGHGREDIAQGLTLDRTVGWFTSIYPVILRGVNAGDDIRGDLIRVKETLHKVPDKGAGYNVLRFLEGEETFGWPKEKIAKISFNYLGETAREAKDGEESLFRVVTDVDTGAVGLKENCFGSDININCMVENGCFKLSVSYSEDFCGQEQMKAIMDEVLAELLKEAEYLNSLERVVRTASDYKETVWTEEEFEAVQADFESRGEEIRQIRPFTSEQEEAIREKTEELRDASYEFVGIFEIDSVPKKAAVSRALARMEEMYDVLAASIVYEGVSVPRCVLSDRTLRCTYTDASGETDPLSFVRSLREELLQEKVDLQRDPLFRLYCVKKDEGSSYLVTAIAPMLGSICGLSEYLLSARLIALLAGETGRNFRITDRVDDSLKKEFTRGGYRICGHFNEFDENKPTLVFIYGIIFHASIQHLVEDWCRKFNMITFDTVNFHFKELFEGGTFDDVADLYMTLLELMVP